MMDTAIWRITIRRAITTVETVQLCLICTEIAASRRTYIMMKMMNIIILIKIGRDLGMVHAMEVIIILQSVGLTTTTATNSTKYTRTAM